MYIVARGRLKVGDTYREVGDPIPEAATWPNLLAYLHGGWITEVSDDAAPTAGAETAAVPAVEVAAAETPEAAALAADTGEDSAPEGTAEEGEPAASEDEAAGPEPAAETPGETNTDRSTRSTRRRGR